MIFYNDLTNAYEFYKEKIDFTHRGERVVKYVGSEGHDWWVEFDEMWDDMTIHKFIPVVPTKEQLARFEKVISGEVGLEQGDLAKYVETGEGLTKPIEPEHELTLEDLYKGQLDVMQALTDMYLMGSGAMDMDIPDLPVDGGGK